MFTEATDYLPATNTDTHALVAYGRFSMYGPGTKARLFTFQSYDLALAGYEAAVEHAVKNGMDETQARMIFAVRSVDDPTVKATGVPVEQYVPWHVISRGVTKAIREEEAETVRWALAQAKDGTGFENIVRMATDSLKERGYKPERWAISDALKSRVIIGRCDECKAQTGGARGRRAYFFKKSHGARLCDTRCPECGSKLRQTSLALVAPFHYIADPASTFFDKSLDRLPGESAAQRDSRLVRFMEALDAENSPAVGSMHAKLSWAKRDDLITKALGIGPGETLKISDPLG